MVALLFGERGRALCDRDAHLTSCALQRARVPLVRSMLGDREHRSVSRGADRTPQCFPRR